MLKKALLAATTLMLTSLPILALPVGNPLEATWASSGIFWEGGECERGCRPWLSAFNFRAGYSGDFVYNRLMEIDQSGREATIRRVELYTNSAFLAMNLAERIDLFATLGVTKLKVQTPSVAFLLTPSPTNNVLNLELKPDFSWSIGARATLWDCGPLGVGIEGEYFSYDSVVNFIDLNFGFPLYLNDAASTHYWEYQVGLGLSYEIPIAGFCTLAVPYLAVKWSHTRFSMSHFVTRDTLGRLVEFFDLQNRYTTGFVVGVTLVGGRIWSLSAEARFADELAAHVKSHLRF